MAISIFYREQMFGLPGGWYLPPTPPSARLGRAGGKRALSRGPPFLGGVYLTGLCEIVSGGKKKIIIKMFFRVINGACCLLWDGALG